MLSTKSKEMSKAKRIEAKKRKIQAFLDVAQLNDNEGRKRASLAKEPRIEEEPVKNERLEGTLEKWANGEGILWIGYNFDLFLLYNFFLPQI